MFELECDWGRLNSGPGSGDVKDLYDELKNNKCPTRLVDYR